MEIDTNIYKRLIEITGGQYNACKNVDSDGIIISDIQSAIKDLITEFDVVEENYSDLREKIIKKIDELEEHKFLIDMIDRWSDGDKHAWEKCVDQIKLLKELLDDREQDRTD